MKVTQLETIGLHAEAIGRGWTEASGTEVALAYPPIERVNGSGAALVEGDVVVIDTDGEIITTTTAQDTRPKGVVLDDIAIGESGPVAFAGPVDLIRVTASVTAGEYAETSTTAGLAQATAALGTASFARFTSSGTSPSAFLFTGGGTGVSASGSLGYVSVADYGAVGDGTTDDTTAIQAAITACDEYATLFFPHTQTGGQTVYIITATLTLTKAIRLLGPSAYPNPDTSPDGLVEIRMTTNNTTAISQSSAKRLGIENLVIDNAGTAASGKGVLALGSVAMRHALIRDFYDNLFIDGQTGDSYVTTIIESFFHNAGRANIYLDDKVNNFRMRGGYISTGPYGIFCSGGIFSMTVDGTAIESYTSAGIYIDGTGPTSGQQTTSVRLASLYMDVVVAGDIPDIFLGDTAAVQSVTIEDIWIEPGNSGQTHIRIDNGDRINFFGGRIRSNAGGSTSISASAATNVTLTNVKADGTVTVPSTTRDYTPFDVTPSSVGSVNSAGTSTYVARADHVHAGTSGAGSAVMLQSDHASPFVFDDQLQASDAADFLRASD